MEIYVHGRESGEFELIPADGDGTVDELVRSQTNIDGASVWLEDAEEPLPGTATLAAAGIGDRDHVHIGTCRITVTVRYGGDSKSRDFAPGATVQSVFAWATGPHAFELTAGERAKHTLAVCGSESEEDRTAHVGSLSTDCALCLDLAPKVRFEGSPKVPFEG